MEAAKLCEMVGGWFVGGFTPTAYSTDSCEVGIKSYKAGQKEASHKHMVATEITVVLYGRLFMVNKEWSEGDIVILAPGEITSFEAITDCGTVVVKIPGALNDKYLV